MKPLHSNTNAESLPFEASSTSRGVFTTPTHSTTHTRDSNSNIHVSHLSGVNPERPSTSATMSDVSALRKDSLGLQNTSNRSVINTPIDFHNIPKHWIWNTTSLLYTSYGSLPTVGNVSPSGIPYSHFSNSAFNSFRADSLGLIDLHKHSYKEDKTINIENTEALLNYSLQATEQNTSIQVHHIISKYFIAL